MWREKVAAIGWALGIGAGFILATVGVIALSYLSGAWLL